MSPFAADPALRVLVTAPRACLEIQRYRDELGAAGCQVDMIESPERLDEAGLLPVIGGYDAIVCGDDSLTAEVLATARRLRVIAKWGTGIDSIDVEAARRLGIAVCNTPGAFSEPVADSVIGYIALFARQLDRMTDGMRAGAWHRVPLRALNECTLGIVGLGDIGSAVARRAAAAGMRILACDVRPITSANASVVPLEQLLVESDFVTLHADLRPYNRHLINAARLALMKPTAVLINTARGPLVDEGALIDALEQKRLGGAALDVFEQEPLPANSRLRCLTNVCLAPHNSNSSRAAAERVHASTIRSVLLALEKVTR